MWLTTTHLTGVLAVALNQLALVSRLTTSHYQYHLHKKYKTRVLGHFGLA